MVAKGGQSIVLRTPAASLLSVCGSLFLFEKLLEQLHLLSGLYRVEVSPHSGRRIDKDLWMFSDLNQEEWNLRFSSLSQRWDRDSLGDVPGLA